MRDRQDRELKAEGERIVEALQRECAHYRGVNEDVERQNRHLQSRVNEMEASLEQKRRELQRHEEVVARYDDSMHELEIQFEVKEQEIQHIREMNHQLKEALDRERILSKDS